MCTHSLIMNNTYKKKKKTFSTVSDEITASTVRKGLRKVLLTIYQFLIHEPNNYEH